MQSTGRLVSLDVFRGIVMFLLMAEGAMIYDAVVTEGEHQGILSSIFQQFHHHPWNGLRFWDLIQPYFMFMVGVSMWFSIKKRKGRGDSQREIGIHILRRSAILLTLGVILHIGYSGKLVWELWNVLSQLSVTIPIAYLLMRKSVGFQIGTSVALLLLMELLYRFTGIPGFDQPFVMDQNFGSYMDMVLMGKINSGGGWVAINCIPTAAHTIWGVLAGKLLDSDQPHSKKIRMLVIAGLLLLLAGYSMDLAGITPIIKRIATSSFVLASGGWCLLTLAFIFWLVDIKKIEGWAWVFIIVGMNPIFIYMFMETIGKQWLYGFAGIFTSGFTAWIGFSALAGEVLTSMLVLVMSWLLCYWLYKKKVFIKI